MKQNKRRGSGHRHSSVSILEEVLFAFRPLFSRPVFDSFTALTSGWIVCLGRRWVSRVIAASRTLGGSRHHSTLYRFLSRAKWVPDEAGRVLLSLARPWLGEVVEAAVDDTLCKRTGPHVFGAGTHFDARSAIYGRANRSQAKKGFAWGLSWVVVAVRVRLPWDPTRGKVLPVLFRLYRSRSSCPAQEYRKRTELAAEMIALLRSWLPEQIPLHFTGDHEYACSTVIGTLPARTTFTGPMPMDAAFFALPTKARRGPGRPRRRGLRQPSPRQIEQDRSTHWKTIRVQIYGKLVSLQIYTRHGLWYSVAKERAGRMIIARDPRGRYQCRAYFTTDEESKVETVLERFARRWLIEVCFREAKQHLGVEDPQNGWEKRCLSRQERRLRRQSKELVEHRGQQAASRTFPFGMIVYALVVLWYVRVTPKQGPYVFGWSPQWYRTKKVQPSFPDMLIALRRAIWVQRISQHPPSAWVGRNAELAIPPWVLAA